MNDNVVCSYSDTLSTEIILCDRDVSLEAHRKLFNFEPGKYIICDSRPVTCLEDTSTSRSRIHASLLWENILGVALWKNSITVGEVLFLLKATGLNDEELKPFRQGSISDIFPVLYYGKHFDVLRKLCWRAKRTAQNNLNKSGMQINCHMVSEETGVIVASSL